MLKQSELDGLMRSVLAVLAVLSEAASGMGWAREGSAERITVPKAGTRAPCGPARAEYEHFHNRYVGCRTEAQRREVVGDAILAIRRARYSRHPTADLETAEGRLLIGRDPRPARVVAEVYGCSVRHVHYLRAAARRTAAA